MKLEQAFIKEANFLGKIDGLIDDIEGFSLDDVAGNAVSKVAGQVARHAGSSLTAYAASKLGGQDDDDQADILKKKKQKEEQLKLDSLYKIIKNKRPIKINGVLVDIFAAVVLMMVLKKLSPVKREIIMSLPMKQILKYAMKNIDKLFVKF